MSEASLVFMGSKKAGLNICRILAEKLPQGILKGIVCPDDSADQRSELEQFFELAKSIAIPLHVG